MDELVPGVWLEQALAQGFPTVAAVVIGAKRVVVVDSLTSPGDMAAARALAERDGGSRPMTLVNTHHHWDHVYGNAAFADSEIVAHEACRRLMLSPPSGEEAPAPPPEGVPLPSMTFAGSLILHDAAESAHVIPAPGHSEDSVVVLLERRGILFAGDALEWPLPSLGSGSDVDAWFGTIAGLRALAPKLIVPSHGPAMGARLLDANERYLEALAAAVDRAGRRAASDDVPRLPGRDFVGPDADLSEVYERSHASNVKWLWEWDGRRR